MISRPSFFDPLRQIPVQTIFVRDVETRLGFGQPWKEMLWTTGGLEEEYRREEPMDIIIREIGDG